MLKKDKSEINYSGQYFFNTVQFYRNIIESKNVSRAQKDLYVSIVWLNVMFQADTSDNYRKTVFNHGLADLVGEITLNAWIITGFSVFYIDRQARAFELWSL